MNDVMHNSNLDSEEELGPTIRAVIHHKTIRGKFSSIHPDLKRLGYSRVEVGDDGLLFLRDSSGEFHALSPFPGSDAGSQGSRAGQEGAREKTQGDAAYR